VLVLARTNPHRLEACATKTATAFHSVHSEIHRGAAIHAANEPRRWAFAFSGAPDDNWDNSDLYNLGSTTAADVEGG
ncbi:MAG: hypothetical protein WCA19_09775, partial [Candidatus Acidiferrales bacterium]